MPIVKLHPEQNAQIQLTTPESVAEPSSSNFNELVPDQSIVSLIQYTEGSPWTVDYYGQIVNKNNTLNSYDPSIPNLLNPYYLIKGMILSVDQPLSSNYDSATGITTISGVGNCPLTVTPNVGDLFVAKVDNGEDGIFIVNNVSRHTHHKTTLYEIQYSLYSYVSVNPTWLENIESKVQDRYYFNPDTNFYNRELLITPEVKEAKDRLKDILRTSRTYYFNKFIHPKLSAFLIPGVDKNLVDTKFTEYIFATNGIYDYPQLLKAQIHNDYNEYYLKDPTILQAIINRNINYLPLVNKKYHFVSTYYFRNTPALTGMGVVGVDYMLYPENVDLSSRVDYLPYFIEAPDATYQAATDNNSTIDPTLTIEIVGGFKNILHPLFEDNYYIVSENFYNYAQEQNTTNANAISFIELLIYKHINKLTITHKDFYMAIRDYSKWPSLHQFYLLPVLWNMIEVRQ